MNDLNSKENIQTATFAGGCFWCMVEPFDVLNGVLEVLSGYTGGTTKDPTYEQVCSGKTGHLEAVQIKFDSALIPYSALLDKFFRQIDPTDAYGQFADRGTQYEPAIFYHGEIQKNEAEALISHTNLSKRFSKPLAIKLLPAKIFYKAEEYHQCYYKKNSEHYESYKVGSGRKPFIEKFWD